MDQIFTLQFLTALLVTSGIITSISQAIKATLKASGVMAYVISLVVSAIIGGAYSLTNHYTVFGLVVYILVEWAAANGWYKLAKVASGTVPPTLTGGV